MKPNKIIDDFDKNHIFHAPFCFNYHCNLGSRIMWAKYHSETLYWPDGSQDTFLKLFSLPWIQIPWRQFIRFLWLTRCHLSVVLTNATSFSQNSLMLLLTVYLTCVFLIGCLQEGVAKHRVQFPPYLPLERKNNVTYCVLWQYSKNLNKSFVHFWRASLKKFTTSSHKESITWKGKKKSHNLFWCCEVTHSVFKNIGKEMKVNRRIFIRTVKLWRL